MVNHFFAQAAALEASKTAFALALIVETKGSTPRHQASMIVKPDGGIIGTIGGGMFERYIIQEAKEAIQTGQSRIVTGNLSQQGATALKMDCGGSAKVLINVFGKTDRLVLVGGGHVNRAIAHLAHSLGFVITIIDTYAPNLDETLLPKGTTCCLKNNLKDAIEEVPIDEKTYVVIATNHEDRVALKLLAQKNPRYLGIMASTHKSRVLKNLLLENDVPTSVVQAIRSPIGLDIGAETPEEIAVSVLAEILSIKNGTSALPLYQATFLNKKRLVLIRGAGEMASGVAIKLHRTGFQIVMLDLANPTSIRNAVSFSQALQRRSISVEGVKASRASSESEVTAILKKGHIAVMADPAGLHIKALEPTYLIDAILAKKNLGTNFDMAPIVIALGSGFTAGKDCHAVIETNRGHDLGRVIYEGKAQDNTGVPGNILGYTKERLVRAPCAGTIQTICPIGAIVKKGQTIAMIDKTPVLAPLDGLLRGLISTDTHVDKNMKIGDVDPRGRDINAATVSDKARAIAGAVLEAILYLSQQHGSLQKTEPFG